MKTSRVLTSRKTVREFNLSGNYQPDMGSNATYEVGVVADKSIKELLCRGPGRAPTVADYYEAFGSFLRTEPQTGPLEAKLEMDELLGTLSNQDQRIASKAETGKNASRLDSSLPPTNLESSRAL